MEQASHVSLAHSCQFGSDVAQACHCEQLCQFHLLRGHLNSWAQVEGQKAEQARKQQEQAVLSKLEKIRLDQTQRAHTLEEEAREAEQKVRRNPSCSSCCVCMAGSKRV